MTVSRPDFAPTLAADLLARSECDTAITAPLADGQVILLRDLYATLSPAQARSLALAGESVYYRTTVDSIIIHAGLIYDKASVPWWAAWWMQRDRIPEAATVHDALYAELRHRQRTWGDWTGDAEYRRLADQIFRRHLRTQEPRLSQRRQSIIYWAVRLCGHRPRKSS